jgi:hypothetical protein
MIKVASLMGVQRALVEAGVLDAYPSFEKAAQAATVASQAMPHEMQAVGEFITPQDLDSLNKVIQVLSELQAMYQQSMGGAAQAPAPAAPAPMGGGAPQMGGMPPPMQ